MGGGKVKGKWLLDPLDKFEHVAKYREMDLDISEIWYQCFVLKTF